MHKTDRYMWTEAGMRIDATSEGERYVREEDFERIMLYMMIIASKECGSRCRMAKPGDKFYNPLLDQRLHSRNCSRVEAIKKASEMGVFSDENLTPLLSYLPPPGFVSKLFGQRD